MGQNFSSFDYGDCRDSCANAAAVFSKSEFSRSVLPTEKFPFLVLARDTIMIQHLVIHFSLLLSYNNSEDARFFHGFTGTINHS